MASEWEELEKLTKEELIIELVKERTARRRVNRRLRMLIDVDYPVDGEAPVAWDDGDDGYPQVGSGTSEAWMRRIALYALGVMGEELSPYDLGAYGLTDDASEEAYLMLRKDGTITSDRNDIAGWFDERREGPQEEGPPHRGPAHRGGGGEDHGPGEVEQVQGPSRPVRQGELRREDHDTLPVP